MDKMTTKDFLSGSLAHDKMYNRLYKWNDDKGRVEKKTGVSGNWRPIKFTLNHFIKHIMPKCVKYEEGVRLFVAYCTHPTSATGYTHEVFNSYELAKTFVKSMAVGENLAKVISGGKDYNYSCIKTVDIAHHEMQPADITLSLNNIHKNQFDS